jgi:hypothetical protein
MPNPCANNGLCTQTTTGYICSCLYPYTGTNCQQSMLLLHMFLFILSLFFLLVISTTTTATTTTTVATRAPCGTCACIITPCPFVVVTNPCAPNPWFVLLIKLQKI